MKTVNIGDLKAQLSAHIQLVKAGEEVVVCERNQPVARIIPIRLEDYSVQQQRLVGRGLMRLPLKPRAQASSWPAPPGDISDKAMEQVWREERGTR